MKKKNSTLVHSHKRYLLAILFICLVFSPQKTFAEGNELPQKYDPRETGHVTPVKAQTRGICWSYAVTSALESHLAKNGEQHDFSANYFNYLIARNATGTVGENPYSTVISNGGGLDAGFASGPALDATLDWSGPVNETDFPNTITGGQPVSKWQNLNAEKHVQGLVTLPKVSLDISQEENNQRVKTIKDYVYRYGNAIQDNLMFRGYETRYSSQYIPKDRVGSVNHVTTIVGWDDSFSKERFVYTPSQDGAFIVKNSWGSNWGDQGYFYISYDDFQLKKSEIDIITSVENKNNYYKKYNVAYFTAGQLVPVFPNKERTLATSYSRTLDTPEQLSAVSLKTLTNDMNYEIYVMPNGKPLKNLEGFTKIQEGTKKEVGTETIRLKKPVALTGEDFSIAVVYRSSDKKNGQNLPVSPKEKIGLNKGSSYSLENNGKWSEETFRSFFISGFTERTSEIQPTSVTVQKNKLSLLVGDKEQLSATLTPKNTTDPSIGFRSLNPEFATVDSSGVVNAARAGKAKIEAFSTRNPGIKTEIDVTINDLPMIQEIQLSQTTLVLEERKKATLTAETFPKNAAPQKIIWSTSNPLIATVTQTGEITWKQAGQALITASTENGSVKASCTLTTNSAPYSNGHTSIGWATDLRDNSRNPLYITNPAKETIYFQYGAGFMNDTKDNWVEFHLTTPQGKTFSAMDYPEISWFNTTNMIDSITGATIEYTKDGENFSSEKPAIQELEGFRVFYSPEVTSNLRLFVNLKLKVQDLKEEDKGKSILPIQLKSGYDLYRPTTKVIADGTNPSIIKTFNVHFTK
ncbi:hypothetical protein ATZ33_11555 [Enterococcus silesiacus]|uniref:Peptidase C1A papain C-terminal domain-containing protein n=1 Tax=Enterococcus silesiacus TaxID=332949 RepID=A0A0S3KCG2_9ENTE|nr:Ig-like domain-containing protein [Enterococcus silesiacus]ALS01994.1 hypothetical protein ATZ33_11555 [Enterococcus silesiacus]OJG89004.1 hypothetical protein RV15_GL001740 [Enterococcus silesiacus]